MTLSGLLKSLVTAGLLLSTAIAAQENISVPKGQNEYDEFAQKILIKALQQSHYTFTTSEYDRELSKTGLVEALRHQDIDVAWLPASDAQEKDFNAIRIPVFKGALSYYRIHTNHTQLQQLTTISIADIKQKHIGLLRRDANLQELAQLGFRVSGAKDSEGLKRMLEGERFDLIVSPLFVEKISMDNTQQHIRSNTIVFAANPHFFTVQQSRPGLARAIQKGLEIMHKNGSIDQSMAATPWIAASMEKLENQQQEIIRIHKPDAEYAAFDRNNEYWLHPPKSTLVGAL